MAFEDVGRHNALDKLIVLSRRRDRRLRVPVEPRELERKAHGSAFRWWRRSPAPSSLAIEIAKAAGLRLVSFCRETGHVDYGTA